MRIKLPASRFKMAEESEQVCSLGGGSAGSAPLRNPSSKKVYIVLDTNGLPVKDSANNYKTFAADQPSQAAIKAYYGLLRSKKTPGRTPTPTELANVSDIVGHLVNNEDLEEFMKKVRKATLEPPALIRIRRIDSPKVKSYVAWYELINNPNKHELRKGIVKVAKTELLEKYKGPVPLLKYI